MYAPNYSQIIMFKYYKILLDDIKIRIIPTKAALKKIVYN